MRHTAGKLTSVILVLLSSLTFPIGVVAAELASPNEHRIAPNLDFTVVRDLAVSEASNRVIVAGDDKVQLVRLDDLSLVISVDTVAGAKDLRVHGDSAFVAGSTSGVVTELSMNDGQIRNQWTTNTVGVSSIDVSNEHVYFTFDPQLFSFDPELPVSGIARITRATGAIDHFSVPQSIGREPLVRVNPLDSNEVFIGYRGSSPMRIYRYSLDGLDMTLLSRTPHGPTGANLKAFEVAQDGRKVWSASGSPYRLVEMDGQTLGLSPVTYEGSAYPIDVSVERSADQLIVMATKGGLSGSIWLFERGAPAARNKVDYSGEMLGTAVTTSEFFAVLDSGGGPRLHAWSLEYHEVENAITVFAEGHGYSHNGETSFTIRCGSFDQMMEINYGTSISIVIPAGLRDCKLWHSPNGVLATRLMVKTGLSWTVHEATHIQFDPAVQEAIALFDYLPSPTSDIDLFVDQSFIDTTGDTPSWSEHQVLVESIASGRVTPANFVVNLMDESASYTRSRAPIARLYRAYFLRDPDAAGIAYWVGISESGTSLIEVSNLFASAREFDIRYGSLSNTQFLDLVYQNVMGRSPDQAGFTYWLGLMDSGLTRGEVMMYFSESREFGNHQNGRIFIDYAVRTLAKAMPTANEHEQLHVVYEVGGREAVVEAILTSPGYFHRFWISIDAGLAALRASRTDAPEVSGCHRCRPVLERGAGTFASAAESIDLEDSGVGDEDGEMIWSRSFEPGDPLDEG